MSATLYYSVLSTGSANFIAAHKAGILGSKLTAHQVDLATKTILTGPNAGGDFFAVNPRGNVPAIVLESGVLLNENSATLQWIVDNATTSVGPKAESPERLVLQTQLSFISSELHGVIHDLFSPSTTDPVRKYLTDKLKVKLQYANDHGFQGGRKFLLGNEYTVADSYLYFILSVAGYVGVEAAQFPVLKTYLDNLNTLSFINEAQRLMAQQTNQQIVTLYYNPLSSGIANIIAAQRAGLLGSKILAQKVDLGTKTVLTGPRKGAEYLQINPKGTVPAIILQDGTVLNQNASTLQWILDNAKTSVGAANGTEERYVIQSKLSYVSSELHGVIHDTFSPATTPEAKAYLLTKLKSKLQYINDKEFNDGRKYWVGADFSVADAYLYFVLFAIGLVGVELSESKNLKVYFDGLNALPFVQEAHAFVAQHSE
ncbi:UNVERIFIED_CONTAM: hypothetical protein HDU68_012445 [Siphonaria sp. JEL0065]|nr:hypothetical protein HDU68_012445 [Siphonaria sp. JEL0065]